MDRTDEVDCVARCLRGDASAFEPLVARYERPLFRMALRVVGDYEEAREATQNAFVKAYQRLDTYDPTRKFFSWLCRIAMNEALNLVRARRPAEELPEGLAARETVFDDLATAQLRRRIERALGELTPEYRQVVALRHFGELSYEEISEVVGVPVKTVKSRLFSARQKLAVLLAPLGGRQEP